VLAFFSDSTPGPSLSEAVLCSPPRMDGILPVKIRGCSYGVSICVSSIFFFVPLSFFPLPILRKTSPVALSSLPHFGKFRDHGEPFFPLLFSRQQFASSFSPSGDWHPVSLFSPPDAPWWIRFLVGIPLFVSTAKVLPRRSDRLPSLPSIVVVASIFSLFHFLFGSNLVFPSTTRRLPTFLLTLSSRFSQPSIPFAVWPTRSDCCLVGTPRTLC